MTEQRAAWLDDPDMRNARLRRHVEIVKEARPEIAVDSDDPAEMQYMHRRGAILVRDTDLPRVQSIVPGDVERSLINGVTLYRPRDSDIEAVLTQIDTELGVGVATPDHALHVTISGLCPATEPEGVDLPPLPGVNADQASDGTGVLVSVVDTGFLPSVAEDARHRWLAGVRGDEERVRPPYIRPFEGHGTFVAGIVRCLAPKADVRVEGFLRHGGTIFESEIVTQLDEALNHVPDIISLSGGTLTRNNLPPLSFEVFWENRLRHYKGTVLVAAAG
ncbi:MAG TPA: S8 family serine peptidase, partial [Jatrophihabitantaceae bacterium]